VERNGCRVRRRSLGSSSVTVAGRKSRLPVDGADHEEEEAQEGKVGHRDINRDLMMRTDSLADQGPEDEQRQRTVHPR